jgi:hypothetical protein
MICHPRLGNLYHNHAILCFPGKKFAAKERKEHEGNIFHLCVLCVPLRQFPVIAAQAALGPSVSIYCLQQNVAVL